MKHANVVYFCTALILLAVPAHASTLQPKTIIVQVNNQRAKLEEDPLIARKALMVAAQAKADDMAKNDYFAHKSPTGANVWDFVGYKSHYELLGENLARGFDTSEDVVSAWMKSRDHRRNIILPVYAFTGIGIASNSSTTYVVQYFGE